MQHDIVMYHKVLTTTNIYNAMLQLSPRETHLCRQLGFTRHDLPPYTVRTIIISAHSQTFRVRYEVHPDSSCIYRESSQPHAQLFVTYSTPNFCSRVWESLGTRYS